MPGSEADHLLLMLIMLRLQFVLKRRHFMAMIFPQGGQLRCRHPFQLSYNLFQLSLHIESQGWLFFGGIKWIKLQVPGNELQEACKYAACTRRRRPCEGLNLKCSKDMPTSVQTHEAGLFRCEGIMQP